MPSATAGRLCPKGVFVRPRMDRYKEESGFILKLMAETGAVIEPLSIDKAYLDLSDRCQDEDADGSLLQCAPIARQLKERIRSERVLTATIGIASNKLLAKIASDFDKPDGLTVVSERRGRFSQSILAQERDRLRFTIVRTDPSAHAAALNDRDGCLGSDASGVWHQ